MRPLPQRATELLWLDLEAETGIEIVVIITIITIAAASLPSVCRECQGRPPAAPPPALRPGAPLHWRRAADPQHVRQGEAQQRVLPGTLVVSFFFGAFFFLSFLSSFVFVGATKKEREKQREKRDAQKKKKKLASPKQNNRDSTSPGACPRAELVRRWNERNERRKEKRSSALSSPTPPLPGGLPLPQLLSAAAAFLANAPVELYESPLNPRYWSDAPLRSARESAAAALEALWPERYRGSTAFPLRLPEPPGPVLSHEWNATAALAHAAYRQIGRAWAAVHTLVHNAPDPLSPRQAEASAALALWLRQHVSCCNCRGFFSQLLNEVGLPPLGSTSREEHARWWWRTHNAVSEHAASTRGG